jgi:primosomal protein N''
MSNSLDSVDKKLQEHLQQLYRQVIDADHYLDTLRQQGKAKFQDVFADNSLFACSGNRFQPYLNEIAAHYEQWQQNKEDEQQLQILVQQLQLMTETLARLKFIRQSD